MSNTVDRSPASTQPHSTHSKGAKGNTPEAAAAFAGLLQANPVRGAHGDELAQDGQQQSEDNQRLARSQEADDKQHEPNQIAANPFETPITAPLPEITPIAPSESLQELANQLIAEVRALGGPNPAVLIDIQNAQFGGKVHISIQKQGDLKMLKVDFQELTGSTRVINAAAQADLSQRLKEVLKNDGFTDIEVKSSAQLADSDTQEESKHQENTAAILNYLNQSSLA